MRHSNANEIVRNTSIDIILSTANARYSHSSLGLRYLYANLGSLQNQTMLLEHTIKDDVETLVDQWLKINPRIIGLGIYIWNIDLLSQAILRLKQKRADIIIIIGGPEVSYGVEIEIEKNVDYIVQLEGEIIFKHLCSQLLAGQFPAQKTIRADVIDTDKLIMPYDFYTEQDIKHRKIYVEASRGCAFKCHFCLSSLDDGIRNFNIDIFLSEMRKLYQKGVRQFKFVDRTFNLDIKLSTKILNFFLELDPDQDYFLHFEVIPDRLPAELKKLIELFKPGVLQFEVGIQTLDKIVSDRIGRRQNKQRALENLSYLRHQTNAHLHTDLIIGLPGATLEIFKADLNQLINIGLQEVQVGILKNLKGTPLTQHIDPFHMIFESYAPYEIQSNKDLNRELLAELRVFHKFWDKYYNSGNFKLSMVALFNYSNPFDEFRLLSRYTYEKLERDYSISLDKLAQNLLEYFMEEKNISFAHARELILKDILIKQDRKIPQVLRDYDLGVPKVKICSSQKSLKRQT
jgi:radical SAM superfamily enzyme YgiQ (UPF0313 family)